MKRIICLTFAIAGTILFTGCEHHHYRGDRGYGRPPAYDYGTGGGPGYSQGWDRR